MYLAFNMITTRVDWPGFKYCSWFKFYYRVKGTEFDSQTDSIHTNVVGAYKVCLSKSVIFGWNADDMECIYT